MQKNIVITIARQYGSGGKTVGEMLAKKLDIHYYDRELMKLASEESGINEALFANADKMVKGNSLFRASKNVYGGELLPPDSDDFTDKPELIRQAAGIKCDEVLGAYRVNFIR